MSYISLVLIRQFGCQFMYKIIKIAICCSFIIYSSLGLSAPAFLLTHNLTDEESNAHIDGIPSLYPTKARSHSKVYWNLVRVACHGHSVGNSCTAVIKMATNTPNPIEIGEVHMDLTTGDITPKQLSANGYTLVVNGPGETTLTKP